MVPRVTGAVFGILFSHMTAPTSVIVKRGSAGLGLFASRTFKRGDFIIEYTGEHISHEEADRRGGKYLFILSDALVVDGRGRENIARYINHSCRPNAEAETDEDEGKIRIFATRTIRSGDEITYDYGKEYFDQHIGTRGCACTPCAKKIG